MELSKEGDRTVYQDSMDTIEAGVAERQTDPKTFLGFRQTKRKKVSAIIE